MTGRHNGTIIIMTEAGHVIGMGHLVRMRGLKEGIQADGYPVEIFVQQEDKNKRVRLNFDENECDWINSFNVSKSVVRKNDIIVLDSYKTELSFINNLAKICRKVIVIDDYKRLDYENTVIINPNYYGSMMGYPKGRGNTYFLGKEYTLLRPEFRYNGKRIISQNTNKILITMGGTDLLGITPRIIDFCHETNSEASLEIVVTDQYKNIDRIIQAAGIKDTVHYNLNAVQMNQLMNEVDFAIAAAGGTSNELIKTECPSILIQVADNQGLNVRYLEPLNYFRIFDADHLEMIQEMYSQKVRQEIFNVLDSVHTEKSAKDAVEFVYTNM